MKLRLKTKMAGPNGCFDVGDIINVPQSEGGGLVAGGFAVEMDQAEAPPERAVIEAAETRRKNSKR